MLKKSLILVGLVICSQVHTQTIEEKIEQAKAKLVKLKENQNIPGLSVAVGVGGQLVWQEGIGFANVKDQRPVEVDTKFRIGSISKTMTAIGLGTLFDTERIDWADSLSQYLPQFKDKKYQPTIRQVAGHQGGIRHYKGMEFISKRQFNSIAESMTVFEGDKLLFEPGTQYSYSTYGYVALGRVVEKVTNQDYLAFMEQAVFQPLGMKNTIPEDAGRDESNSATLYSKGGKRPAMEVNQSSRWAGGGFLSTPTDIVKMIHGGSKIIAIGTLYELITPQNLKDGEKTNYGMGFRISQTSSGQMVVHHGGRSAGARAFLLVLPAEQVVVAICSNTEADFGVQEVYDIAKLFM